MVEIEYEVVVVMTDVTRAQSAQSWICHQRNFRAQSM